MTQTRSSKLRLRALAAALAVAFIGPAFAAQVNTGGLQNGGQYDRFIIRFANGTAEAGNSTARQNAFDAAGRAEGLAIGHLLRLAVGADVIKTNRKLDRNGAEALMRRLANNPDVEYVEVDKLNKIVSTPNDSSYSQQWQYFNATGGIKADQAWDLSTGSGAVVAILDTGITNHSDLNANILPGYDFIKDTSESVDGNGRDSDPHDPGDWNPAGACGAGSSATNSSWHGTHVAGTVAAVTNNATGVAGTAYGAKIVPARVLGRCGGYDSDIADAIVWASGGAVLGVPANAYPAEVISLSLGGSGPCGSTTQSAINGAVSRGTTLVIAAGNDNANVSGSSPANCANVIAVGASTSSGAKASFSNYGAGVDISAPGQSILSTLNAGTTTPGAESYATYSGTSMATPHVAGVVALMQSYATTPKTPSEIESLIKSTARAFPVTPSQPMGAGIINARAAVEAVRGTTSTPPPSTGGTVLSNGVVVALPSRATGGVSPNFTLLVPAGKTTLTFVISGGTGDADLYVRRGAAPTASVYDCRPYKTGNSETCTFSSPVAATYYVNVRAYQAYSGVFLRGTYSP